MPAPPASQYAYPAQGSMLPPAPWGAGAPPPPFYGGQPPPPQVWCLLLLDWQLAMTPQVLKRCRRRRGLLRPTRPHLACRPRRRSSSLRRIATAGSRDEGTNEASSSSLKQADSTINSCLVSMLRRIEERWRSACLALGPGLGPEPYG